MDKNQVKCLADSVPLRGLQCHLTARMPLFRYLCEKERQESGQVSIFLHAHLKKRHVFLHTPFPPNCDTCLLFTSHCLHHGQHMVPSLPSTSPLPFLISFHPHAFVHHLVFAHPPSHSETCLHTPIRLHPVTTWMKPLSLFLSANRSLSMITAYLR